MAGNRLNVWAALIFAAAFIALMLTVWQSQLVAPSTPANTGFSQADAFETLTRLIKEETPHPAGSPENAVVRDRILEEFRAYGYAPEIQSAFQCEAEERYPGCTQVENIIAVHKGTGGGKAILATSHYDSVPAGPGAGDDGAGTVVMLELARAYAGKATKNDVIFLISDGEETGLRGAYAFAERHPLMKQVGIVVNVEARGASGPSLMFETGTGNARLIDLYAKNVAHPAANSLAYEIYKLLPNDTDFSVYRKHGLTGFNFAFSNSASLYHSKNDNLANLNRDTLQHHGDNAFAVVGALADADLEALKSTEDASYFDVFGHAFHVWPASINAPIALVALLGLIGLIVMHRAAFTLRGLIWSVLAFIAVPLLLFGIGMALSFPLGHWPGVHPLDHPAPWPARVALATTVILTPLLVASAVAGRAEIRAVLLVNWFVFAALALALAVYITGASFTLVWPVLALVVVGWIETFLRNRTSLTITAVVGFVMAAFFYAGYLVALEVVIGFNLSEYKLLAVVPLALALVPVFAASLAGEARGAWLPAAACALVVVVAAVVASRTPAYAPNHPRGLNITYYDDRTAPRWQVGFVGAPDEAYLKATGFPAKDEAYQQIGLLESKGRFKPAADLKLPAPTLTVTEVMAEGATTTVRGTLRSARGGALVGIAFAPTAGVRSLRADNQDVLGPQHANAKAPVIARFTGIGSRELPVEIKFDTAAKGSITLYERSALPDAEEALALTQARTPDAAPVHSGDNAVVFVKVDLSALKPPAN